MDKAKLFALIALLYAGEIETRAVLVKEAVKENGVKEGDLYKALKEAGYDPKAPKGTAVPAPSTDTPPAENGTGSPLSPPDNDKTDGNNGSTDAVKKIPVILRHKTGYPQYRRAGLVLTQKAETYEVTGGQLAVLEKDPWVVIKKEDGREK